MRDLRVMFPSSSGTCGVTTTSIPLGSREVLDDNALERTGMAGR